MIYHNCTLQGRWTTERSELVLIHLTKLHSEAPSADLSAT